MKKFAFILTTAVVALCVSCVAGEVLVRLVSPVVTLHPRWENSPAFGHRHHANVTMVHKGPGGWTFTYRINEYGYRTPPIPFAEEYDKENILILGDSNAFGFGVDEGDQFPAVMNERIGEGVNVINLAVGGYALTQEIRVYYDAGRQYKPSTVILQFADNDPDDNYYSPVTRVEDGRFVFAEVDRAEGWLKNQLSKSPLQKSHLYNTLRHLTYRILYWRTVNQANDNGQTAPGAPNPQREELYNSLLETFAKDLSASGVRLIFIAAGEGTLEEFPAIAEKVRELQAAGHLEYVDVHEWISDPDAFPPSPEGHVWGTEAHRRLGQELARYVSRRSD